MKDNPYAPSRRGWRSTARCTATLIAGTSLSLFAHDAHAEPGLPYNGQISFGAYWAETNGRSDIQGMSDDANFVSFCTNATNLTSEDTNTRLDCFRYDRVLGINLLASVATNGAAGNAESVKTPANSRMITPDGRYLLFTSFATDLIASDTNNQADAFIRDFNGWGSTERVSLSAGGAQIANASSFALGISTDAVKILFTTRAALSAKDSNGLPDIYLYDRVAKTTTLVSTDLAGNAVGSSEAVLAETGRHVAFTTVKSANPADTNLLNDVYWKDVTTGITKLISLDTSGESASGAEHPAISGDGTRVGFVSRARNLVSGDTNGAYDVFVKDVLSNAVFRASTPSSGSQVVAPRCESVSLNGNGHIASLACRGNDLVSGDSNGQMDVFIKNLDTGAMTLVSRVQGGAFGNADSGTPVISRNGAVVGFTSAASNLFWPDSNAVADVMVGVIE